MQKILVIEDEELVRVNIIELLEAEDFEVVAAPNGRIGVQLAQAHSPDLIICDIRMPEQDGLGVLRQLRQDSATATIPFIFLTASGDRTDLRQGMELGADDYLVKPCTTTELLQAIAARLTKQLVVTQLQQQVQELQQLSVLKDEFLSEASHDLRAPLANMKIAIQLLKVASTDEQRQRYLNLLEKECDRETALVNDLLDLQRIEANTYSLSPQPLSLPTWIPFVIEPFESRVQQQQQTLAIEISENLPPLIVDPLSLQRVLTELLNNACKYTVAKGQIILNVGCKTPIYQGCVSEFIFTLKNQGEISAEDIPRIFEKFYRVSNSNTLYQSGTGLGLALVRKLVEQMGGTIWVESNSGWTTFTIQLPAKLEARTNSDSVAFPNHPMPTEESR
jgi:signal transduction histidine kinase